MPWQTIAYIKADILFIRELNQDKKENILRVGNLNMTVL